MRLRYKFVLTVIVLGSVFLLGRCGGLAPVSKSTLPVVLPINDREQIIVNPETHQLIVLRKGQKNETLTLPDRASVIDIHNDNSVKVTAAQMGLEHAPFLGLQLAVKDRLMIGLDGFYWKRLDLGVGFAMSTDYKPVLAVLASYNVWSNSRIGITYDTQAHVGLALTVRL